MHKGRSGRSRKTKNIAQVSIVKNTSSIFLSPWIGNRPQSLLDPSSEDEWISEQVMFRHINSYSSKFIVFCNKSHRKCTITLHLSSCSWNDHFHSELSPKFTALSTLVYSQHFYWMLSQRNSVQRPSVQRSIGKDSGWFQADSRNDGRWGYPKVTYRLWELEVRLRSFLDILDRFRESIYKTSFVGQLFDSRKEKVLEPLCDEVLVRSVNGTWRIGERH